MSCNYAPATTPTCIKRGRVTQSQCGNGETCAGGKHAAGSHSELALSGRCKMTLRQHGVTLAAEAQPYILQKGLDQSLKEALLQRAGVGLGAPFQILIPGSKMASLSVLQRIPKPISGARSAVDSSGLFGKDQAPRFRLAVGFV